MATSTTQAPDGKGGWVEVTGELIKGSEANPEKQAHTLAANARVEAYKLAKSTASFVRGVALQDGLTKEQLVYAMAFYLIDLRETYPDGVDAFDAIAEEASAYYDEVSK